MQRKAPIILEDDYGPGEVCPDCGAGPETMLCAKELTQRVDGRETYIFVGYDCKCGAKFRFRDTLGGSIFCSICNLMEDNGTPCRLCKRTEAPERANKISLNQWLTRRNLSIPKAEE